jgi:1,4-alpha-glucan branching enzyme
MRRCLIPLLWLAASVPLHAQVPALGSTVNKSGAAVTGVTFRVWAPNALAVSVTGEFNGWNTSANALAKEAGTPWNGIWSATVATARPGHAYKYSITPSTGAAVWKKDPRARQMRTQNDGTQASVVYDKDAFDWAGDNFAPPFPNEIVMYELHIGTFHDPRAGDGEPATFDDAILRLPYLQSLGVNMIALMPVNEFGGRHSWGYNPTDLFAIEESYGGPDGLKRFVKAAHQQGMAVQVDVVHNHYDGTSDLKDFDGPSNPYFYTAPSGLAMTQWGPRPRYSDPNVRQFISDQINMLLDEYKIWALRWDSPRNITAYDANGDLEPDTAIPEAVAMMNSINESITTRSLSYYSIAEDASVPGGYHGHWEVAFHNYLLPQLLPRQTNGTFFPPFNAALADRTLAQFKYRVETKDPPGFRVIFSDNHDKSGDLNQATDGQRLAHDFDAVNPSSWFARKKSMLAAAITLTSSGTPMLFMGQEQLADGVFGAYEILDWLKAGRFPEVVRFHRDLVKMRRNAAGQTKALTFVGLPPINELTGNTAVVHLDEANKVMVYERKTESAAESMLVAVNFSATDRVAGFSFPSPGPWRCYLNSDQQLYGSDFRGIGLAHGATLTTTGSNNFASLIVPALSAVILGKATAPALAADANANSIDDGWEILFGADNAASDLDSDGFSNAAEYANGTDPTVADRARLPGTFNDWNITTDTMRWDPSRNVWRYVARFATPGTQLCKAYLATGWVTSADHSFDVAQAGTYEITYSPANRTHAAQRVDTDADANGLSDAWERFYFYPLTTALPAADPDADGLTNLQEFQRASDPTNPDRASLTVAGAFNGWNWQAANMRYAGHGVWTLVFPFRTAPSDRAFKIGAGPTSNDANWGDTASDGIADYFSPTDMQWPVGATGWQVLRFNERNLKYSVAPGGNADRDVDGMPDAWEQHFGLDPFVNDAGGDKDGDNVRNIFEFARLTSPVDASDHFAAMHAPYDGFWDENDPRTAMKWNAENARWEYVFFAPRAGSRDFKFMAGTYGAGTWGWSTNGTGTSGQTIRWANGNIRESIAGRGHYLVRFEEAAGTYEFLPLPQADTDRDGMPDVWERFHAFDATTVDGLYDADSDGAPNAAEYRRGGQPRVADHFAHMRFVGSLNGWSFSATPLRWNAVTSQWELLQRVTQTATNQEGKFSAGTSWNDADWGDNEGDGIGDRDNGTNIKYSVATAPSYLHFRFDEISLDYVAGPMSLADSDSDGLPDVWAAYHGVAGADGNPDNDPFTNAQEFARGSNPQAPDDYFRNFAELRVVGSFNGWTPSTAPLMTMVGDNTWRADLNIANSAQQEFKFVAGNSWSATNWGNGTANATLPDSGPGTYRFTVDDTTRAFTVIRLANTFAERYPGISADQMVRGRPALLDYLFGGTAAQAPREADLPVAAVASGKLRLTFVTRTNDTALSHRVTTKTDLAAGLWTTNGVTELPAENLPDGMQRRTYEVPVDSPQRYLRIEAEIR